MKGRSEQQASEGVTTKCERLAVALAAVTAERDQLAAQLAAAVEVGLFGPGKTIAELEKAAILVSMARHGNAVTKVAKELGLSKRLVHYRLKDYGWVKPTP